MSTRAVYSFKGDGQTHHVYVHHDGYPTGAADKFAATLKSGKIWGGDRFEADEFAAGFVAANKAHSGSVRLFKTQRAAADVEFAYTVWQDEKTMRLMVRAQSVDAWDEWKAKTIWTGTLAEFIETGAESAE